MKLPGLFLNAKTIQEVPAGTLIFDETFGEMAVVDSSPRSATVIAVTDTRLAVIDRRMFLFLVHETPMFALQVMSSMAERLRAEQA